MKTANDTFRLLERGPAGMTTDELLGALLLRGRHDAASARSLGEKIMKSARGSLTLLFGMTPERLLGHRGLSPDDASALLAAMELGRRYLEEDAGADTRPIVCARMVCDYMLARMKSLDHEECWVLYLDGRSCVAGRSQLCVGGLDSTTIDTRRIIRDALDLSASSVILVHNHPSGNPQPSVSDIRETERLRTALHSVGLTLADHVILTRLDFFSFAESR